MPRPRRKTGSPKQAKAETKESPRQKPKNQYQHFIPRFILRRFQVGPVKSKAERNREFRRTGVDPEYVHYYDVATGSLDIRPIGKVYGVKNIYQDVRNTENINELEDKLGGLERQAASIITNLHNALPQGTFTLKRRDLELLRKFFFVMHYHNVACSSIYFQVDHPENARARQFIEFLMKAKGASSAVEAWLYFLRYYLDKSHSDIMSDAAELVEKYGYEGLERVVTGSHFPPDLELFPSISYHAQAEGNFLSIWEAAEGEEFILTNHSFGLSEGMAGKYSGVHTIFIVSPRIAIVLRNVLLHPRREGPVPLDPINSVLLQVQPAPTTTIYSNGKDYMPVGFTSPRLAAQYRSSQEAANDSFLFTITKLSQSQTLELNSIVLFNLDETSALTFLSRENMLRTARSFRNSPRYFLQSNLNVVVPLIDRLVQEPQLPVPFLPLQSPAASPDEDIDPLSLVDVELYVLLLQICTGKSQFPSAYERAHLVHSIMEKSNHTTFAREISKEVDKVIQACKEDFEEMRPLDRFMFSPLLPSIPSELSSQLFHVMIPYMSKLGAVMSGGEGILEELQDEVIVMSFLTRASYDPSVWHSLSCSSPEVPLILSGLFKEGTHTDRLVILFTRFMYKKVSTTTFQDSCYDQALWLRGVCGMAGPTTNPISRAYYELAAAVIGHLGRTTLGSLPAPHSSQPRERPKARIVRTMSELHSDLLMSDMEMIVRKAGYTPSSEEDTRMSTAKKWVYQMAVVNALAWLGKHRRNHLDFLLDGFLLPTDFKLFEEEEA